MPKLILTKGLPASGKTTWALEYIKNNPNAVIVCKDDIRDMLLAKQGTKSVSEKKVKDWRDSFIATELNEGKDVIVADTNLNPEHEEHLRSLFSKSATISIKYFNVDPRTCVERDKKREKSVGSMTIWNMYNKYLKKGDK